jgi:hypothetical protein
MLPLISVLFGGTMLIASSVCLWFTLAKPKEWARFTEAETAFMLKRGFPVKWAGPYKRAQQGLIMKVVVGGCLLMAGMLVAAPFVIRHHG